MVGILRPCQHLFPLGFEQSPTGKKSERVSKKDATALNRPWRFAHRQHHDQTARFKQGRLRNTHHRLRPGLYDGRAHRPKTKPDRLESDETCRGQNKLQLQCNRPQRVHVRPRGTADSDAEKILRLRPFDR